MGIAPFVQLTLKDSGVNIHAAQIKLILVFYHTFIINNDLTVEAFEILQIEKQKKVYDCLRMNIHLTVQVACELFISCSKVPEAAQMSSSGQGFLQFQVK